MHNNRLLQQFQQCQWWNGLSSLVLHIPKHNTLVIGEYIYTHKDKGRYDKFFLHNMPNRNSKYLEAFSFKNKFAVQCTKLQKVKKRENYRHTHPSSSSSFCRAISTDIPDPLLPLLPIVQCFRLVFRTAPCFKTEQLYVGSSWSPCFCSAMWRGPQEYINKAAALLGAASMTSSILLAANNSKEQLDQIFINKEWIINALKSEWFVWNDPKGEKQSHQMALTLCLRYPNLYMYIYMY